jgi:hypothetical protein
MNPIEKYGWNDDGNGKKCGNGQDDGQVPEKPLILYSFSVENSFGWVFLYEFLKNPYSVCVNHTAIRGNLHIICNAKQ